MRIAQLRKEVEELSLKKQEEYEKVEKASITLHQHEIKCSEPKHEIERLEKRIIALEDEVKISKESAAAEALSLASINAELKQRKGDLISADGLEVAVSKLQEEEL